MKKKYYICLGAFSFLLGVAYLLPNAYSSNIWGYVMYGVAVVFLLFLITRYFAREDMEKKVLDKILVRCYGIGAVLGYCIYYMFL